MTVLAHIVGIPVEEAALSVAPVASVLGGVLFVQLRGVLRRERGGGR